MKRLNLFFIFYHCLITFYFKFGIVEGIVGGADVAVGTRKYIVSVQANGIHVCGGTIIEEGHAITAAHCVIDLNNQFTKQKITLRGGVYDLSPLDGVIGGIIIDVAKIFVPAEYKRIELQPDTDFYNEIADIAIIKFQRRITLPHVLLSKAEIPPRTTHRFPLYYKSAPIFVGFGSDIYYFDTTDTQRDRNNYNIQRRLSATMKEAVTTVLHKNNCKPMYPFRLNKSHICAKVQQRDSNYPAGTCNGDAGGPLILDGNSIIGILSQNTKDCNELGTASIYTRVTTYIPLINRVLKGRISDEVRVAEHQIVATQSSPLGEEVLVEIQP